MKKSCHNMFFFLSLTTLIFQLTGRLIVSNMNGRNDIGTFEGLYTFGGRSFSIRKLDTMDLVYDSGSQIEELHEQYIGKLFNSNGDTANDTIPQTFDIRSANKVNKRMQ